MSEELSVERITLARSTETWPLSDALQARLNRACGATGGGSYNDEPFRCTLLAGHAGDHVCRLGERVSIRWPRTTEAP